jgi:hypothetical protein
LVKEKKVTNKNKKTIHIEQDALAEMTVSPNNENVISAVVDMGDYTADIALCARSWKSWNTKYREYHRKSRISVWPDEQFNVMEHLMNRRRRPHSEWRKLIKPVLEKFGIDTRGLVWSQYAFCTCPCSPGFILNNELLAVIGGTAHARPFDIDITLHAKEFSIPTVNEATPIDGARVEAAVGLMEEMKIINANLVGNGVE